MFSQIIRLSFVQSLLLVLFVQSTAVQASQQVLLQGDSGDFALYNMGSQLGDEASGIELAGVTAGGDWSLKAFVDLNGDGDNDLLMRHSNGSWFGYLVKDGVLLESGAIGISANTAWQFKAAQDFNGDGSADVLLRHTGTGNWFVFLLDGLNVPASGAVNLAFNQDWKFQGAADFNGDGKSDVLLRHQRNNSWFLYALDGIGLNQAHTGLIRFALNPNWHFAAAADFTGDGKADMIMRRSDGPWWMYQADGTQVLKNDNFGLLALTGSTTWQFRGIGDFNDDGRSDVLLRNQNDGRWFVYALSGRTKVLQDTGVVNLTADQTQSFNGLGRALDARAYFELNVSPGVIQNSCINCHVQGGLAANTALVYQPATTPDYQQTNFDIIENFVLSDDANASLLLSKARGVAHGGGAQLPSSSEGYGELARLLELMGQDSACTGSCGQKSDFFAGVLLSSPEKTLRRAAIIMAGRLPTAEETAAVRAGGELVLRGVLKDMMQGESFHQFLLEGANDRLLTDKFIEVLPDILNAGWFYPDLTNILYDILAQGGTDLEQWDRIVKGMFGMARAPLELIAHVVENDKPYTEILTADYLMFNPHSNADMRGGATFEDPDNISIFKPGTIQGQVGQDETLVWETDEFGVRYIGGGLETIYPHAGILNSPAFLARYPSTETNRNRARARWAYYHFLGVDIEKSAARTTDPEALADKNNPTLNNENCTVCHQLHDPVAGAFQNYGNDGAYRSGWGGLDSLPSNYKWPEEGTSLYQEGDTWYRDMRAPGFNGKIVHDNTNSLQWLAQEIVEDERFTTATAAFWWQALMGTPIFEAPEDARDANFAARLVAFEAQQADIAVMAEEFAQGFNLKSLLVDMVMSPWFRAESVSDLSAERQEELSDIGIERLLTPKQLERKTRAITGYVWGSWINEALPNLRSTNLIDRFKLYMGGIDSDGVTERSTASNALMTQTVLLHASIASCGIVGLDLSRPDSQRKLFKGLNRGLLPISQASQHFDVTGASLEEADTYSFTTALSTGQWRIRVAFTNDFWDEQLGDRNLFVGNLKVVNSRTAIVAEYNLGEIESIAGASFNTGGQHIQQWGLWSEGYVEVPVEITAKDTYRIEVIAHGDQAGDEAAKMSVDVNTVDDTVETFGANTIVKQIQEYHRLFLNEDLPADHESILLTYQLFLDTLEDFTTSGADPWFNHSGLACDLPPSYWESGDNSDNRDQNHILKTWVVVFAYLMSDYKYFHE